MLKIRLSMGGAKKRPVYKIVVADSRFPRDGRFIEKLGSFNPLLPKEKKERIKLESERVKHWLSKGARPTVRVTRILGEVNIMPMPKPGNNPQKAIPKKDRKKMVKRNQKKKLQSRKLRKRNQRNNNVESTSIHFVSRNISWPFKQRALRESFRKKHLELRGCQY